MPVNKPQRGAAPPRAEALQGVAATKLAPPRAAGRAMAREPLLARLQAARRHRCIVVAGSAGSGKTTLLASWRQSLLQLGFDVAWLSLASEDNELARFLDGLVASMAQVDAALVRDAALLDAGSGTADAAENLCVALVRGIAAHPRELVLVLDDLHHLVQTAIQETLQWLLDYAPANLHLVLSTRGALRLSLDRLRSRAQTLEINPRDLRFTAAETERFLTDQLGALDPRTIRVIQELTDGWAAGLQLFCVDWKKKPRGARTAGSLDSSLVHFARAPMRDARAFTAFFDQQVLAGLHADALDMLLCAAPCTRFCAALCAALLGRLDDTVATDGLLARLESEHLFVVAVEGRGLETWYRLHPLLRETLLARFSAWTEARQRELHARACAWFRDRGQFDDAVRHALQAGEAALAADLVEQCALTLFVKGERRTLISLLRQLPAEQVERSFMLRTWMARSQVYLREFAACAQSLDSMEADVSEADAAARFQIALLRATLCMQRDDTEGALALLPRLSPVPAGVDPIAQGGLNNILSWICMHQREFEKARQIQLDAPARLLPEGTPLVSTAAGSLQGRCLVGLSYALEGQMTQAERIYRAVLAEAEQGGKPCADTYFLALALLADVLYELNDAPQARALLESRVDLLERITIPDAVLRVLRLLSAAHWQADNRMESFAYLERLEDYAVKQGLDRLLAYSLGDQLHRHLLLGELMPAEADLKRLQAVQARYPHAPQGSQAEIRDQVERALVSIAVAHGDLTGAAVRLDALVAECEARGRQRIAANLLVKAAAIDARRGRVQPAHDKLLEALRRGHRLGLLRSLIDADPLARKMIRELWQTGTLEPVLAFYAERLQSSHARKHPSGGPAATGTSAASAAQGAATAESFSEREIEVLRLLAQAMPNKKIARALNLSPETVKWYLSRIYVKLQVAGRDEAVARVRDLGWREDGPAAGAAASR